VTPPITLFTIGFTKKSAERFFTALQNAGVARVLDVRLHNVSQLAGFAKRDDLAYFLKAIAGIDYVHLADLAPTQEMLDAFKKQKGDWPDYERQYLALLQARKAEDAPSRALPPGCGMGDVRTRSGTLGHGWSCARRLCNAGQCVPLQ